MLELAPEIVQNTGIRATIHLEGWCHEIKRKTIENYESVHPDAYRIISLTFWSATRGKISLKLACSACNVKIYERERINFRGEPGEPALSFWRGDQKRFIGRFQVGFKFQNVMIVMKALIMIIHKPDWRRLNPPIPPILPCTLLVTSTALPN